MNDRKRRYSLSAVDTCFGLVRTLHKYHLINPMYYGAAAAMIPAYYILTAIFNRMKIYGKDQLPDDGTGFFLLSNHISILDGQVLSMMTFPRTYWFPSKAEFYKNTAQGLAYTAVTAFKSFPVRRGEKDMRAIALIEDLLRRGENVLLFPEGTRSMDGELKKGKVGVGKIIRDAKPVVIPVYIEGFADILGHGSAQPHVGKRCYLNFGTPLDLDDLYVLDRGKETSEAVVERVMAAIADLREDLHGRPDYEPNPPHAD